MNIKLCEDGPVAFTMPVYFLLSDLSPLHYVVHVQCGAHNDIKRHSDYFAPFK